MQKYNAKKRVFQKRRSLSLCSQKAPNINLKTLALALVENSANIRIETQRSVIPKNLRRVGARGAGGIGKKIFSYEAHRSQPLLGMLINKIAAFKTRIIFISRKVYYITNK